MRNEYEILAGNPEGKSPLGRSKSGLEDNIKWVLEKWLRMWWTGFI
jgi:hypothetical protein